MARKTFIAGNWKMNKTAAETKALAQALKESLAQFGDSVTMAVCPTFTSLSTAVEVLKGSNVKVGAQNIHWADNGAFTGEISGAMLKEIGALARQDIQNLLGSKVFLDLWVKVKKDWRDRDGILRHFGFGDER